MNETLEAVLKMKRREITVIYPCERTMKSVVNSDKTELQLLEDVFSWYNYGSQKESPAFLNSKARSLSVNDFVKIDGNVYQCKSSGWQQVDDEYLKNIELLVESKMKYCKTSAWHNLNDIMYSFKKNLLTKQPA